MKLKMILSVIGGVFACACAQAGDIYVNAKSTSLTEDGSLENPYKTIQAAVDAANVDSSYSFAKGDAIKVLPGEYKTGGAEYTENSYTQNFRVYIGVKPLRLVATGSAADTFIVGQRDTTDSSTYGIGANGVCGIVILSAANGSIIRGFTIRDCCAKEKYQFNGRGAALNSQSTANCLVDCQIMNCAGVGAVGKCLAVRCGFFNNYNWESNRGMVSREANLLHCVLVGNYGVGSVISMGKVINCTIVNNGSQTVTSSNGIYNNVLVNKGSASTLAKYSSNPLVAENNVYSAGYHVLSPATGDYRVTSDSDAAEGGDAKWIAEISLSSSLKAELEPYKDYAGNTVPTTGTIHCGAVQATAERKTGLVQLVSSSVGPDAWGTVNGFSAPLNQYASSSTYPTVFTLGVADTETLLLAHFDRAGLPTLDGTSTSSDVVLPETNNTLRVFAPASTSAIVSLTPRFYSSAKTLYVNGSAEAGGDGSKDAPFQTLAEALAVCTENGNRIHVARGTYKENNLTTSYSAYFIADEGPEVTTLDAEGGAAYNIHDAGASGGFIGFTIKNASGCSVVFQGRNDNTFMLVRDCIVTNCTATGSIFNYARIERTKVLGCTSGRFILDYGRVQSSLVAGCTASEAIFKRNVSCISFGCTISENTSPYTLTSSLTVYNSILEGGEAQAATGLDNIVWNLTDETLLPATGFTKGDSLIFNAPAGDARLMTGSAAANACAIPTADGELARAYTLYYAPDITGTAYDWTQATANAGCSQAAPVDGVRVRLTIDAKGGVDVEGLKTGLTVITEPTTLTITRNFTSAHCVLGVRVNGVLETFDANDQWTITLTPQSESVQISVEDYSTCWYVDANIEQDPSKTYDGMTPQRAYKTLKEAAENLKLVAGDTVWVAEGVYDEGVMETLVTFSKVDYLTRNRVSIPNDVIFEGSGDRAKTLIVGEPDSTTKGLGAEAVRCVLLGEDAILRNVTLTNGYTKAAGNNPDGTGGGVWTPNVNTGYGLVEDCVITCCHAVRGAGMEFGGLRRTRITNCTASENLGCGAALISEASNCIFDGNVGGCVIHYPKNVVNCTFLNSVGPAAQGYSSDESSFSSYKVYNSFIGCTYTKNWTVAYSNCYFTIAEPESRSAGCNEDCVFGVSADQFDANGTPLKSSVLVDNGKLAHYPSTAGDADNNGNPRILNGNKIDVGACEYDWRGVFARKLGNRVTLAEMTSGVTTNTAKRIVLADGDALTVGWKAGLILPTEAKFVFTVTDGTLTITQGGETQEFTAGEDQEWTLANPTSDKTVVFSYEGSGSAAFKKSKLGFSVIIR